MAGWLVHLDFWCGRDWGCSAVWDGVVQWGYRQAYGEWGASYRYRREGELMACGGRRNALSRARRMILSRRLRQSWTASRCVCWNGEEQDGS